MGKRRTHEQFIEELKKINSNIKILGEFKKVNTKIRCKCLLDGYIWETTPKILLRGHTCPECSGNKKKTHKEFIKEVEIKNPNVKILGIYKNAYTKIKFMCLIDGHIWDAKPSSILSSCGCPKCAINIRASKQRKTHEQFVEEMKDKNSNIEIIGKYINNKTKISCKCLIDGYTWTATPNSLLSGQGCMKCGHKRMAKKQTKKHEQFIEEIKIKNPDIEILGTYINIYTKIKCKNLICGHIWEVNPRSLLKGSSCPICNFSKGEKSIENYCKNNYLQYKTQYRIDRCRNKHTLPFDFALFNKNKLIALIEYQGKQHYEVVKHFGGESGFNVRKKRDEIKRNYCISNNIPLIEIPYWIDDVEGYLEEQMDKVINKPLQLSLI